MDFPWTCLVSECWENLKDEICFINLKSRYKTSKTYTPTWPKTKTNSQYITTRCIHFIACFLSVSLLETFAYLWILIVTWVVFFVPSIQCGVWWFSAIQTFNWYFGEFRRTCQILANAIRSAIVIFRYRWTYKKRNIS